MDETMKDNAHNSSSKKDISISGRILSSYALTAVTIISTAVVVLLLFINDRSVGLQILFTIVVALQFLFLLWMFITALVVIYDSFRGNDRIFDVAVGLDFYFMYIFIWTNTGMLFWLWDPTPNRDLSFTELTDLNPFLAWVTFFYITILNIGGVGYGRYIAVKLLAETWVAVLVTFSPILLGILLSSLIALALQNVSLAHTDVDDTEKQKSS